MRSAHKLFGYKIAATDKDLGSVHDLLFDDRTWEIRYLVVDTGHWLPDRKVLVKPSRLGVPDWSEGLLPVNMTAEQIRQGPGIESADADRPAETEDDVSQRWAAYWPMHTSGIMPYPVPIVYPDLEEPPEDAYEEHLRSMDEVIGYRVETTEGTLGHVEDFVVDEMTWKIELVALDTRNWLPGRKVMLPAPLIAAIDWTEAEVVVNLDKETVKSAPEFDADEPVSNDVRNRLYKHFGQPHV